MPGYKADYGLYLWFPLKLHDSGSGLVLKDNPNLKHISVGQCLMLVFGLAYHGAIRVLFSSDSLGVKRIFLLFHHS